MAAISSPLGAPIDESILSTSEIKPFVGDGRRDRKKRATRRAISTAALELVVMRGYDRVTIEDIALAADIAPRTFFNYFASKESAVLGDDPERIEHFRRALLARPATEHALDALREVIVALATEIAEEYSDLGEKRSTWLKRFNLVREDPTLLSAYVGHITEVERIVTQAVAERLGVDPKKDAYPALLTATVLAAFRVASLQWSTGASEEDLPHLAAVAIDSLAAGLSDTTAFAVASKACAAAGPATPLRTSLTPEPVEAI